MLQRGTGFDCRNVTDAAAVRGGLARESPAIEKLIASHSALTQSAMKDFGLNLATLPVPDWMQRELKPNLLRKPLEGLELYCAKEQMRAWYLAKHIMPLLEEVPDGKIVDIGTRSGFFPHRLKMLSELRGYTRHISGLDLSQPLPTDGDQQWDFTQGEDALVQHYDGGRMPYDDGALSAATVNFTFHHVESPSRDPIADSESLDYFLNEAHRVLKPGGVLIATEDYLGKTARERIAGNPYADTVLQTDDLFYPHSLGCQRSQEEWVTILKKHDFKIETEKHIAGYNVVGLPVVELLLKARKQ